MNAVPTALGEAAELQLKLYVIGARHGNNGAVQIAKRPHHAPLDAEGDEEKCGEEYHRRFRQAESDIHYFFNSLISTLRNSHGWLSACSAM